MRQSQEKFSLQEGRNASKHDTIVRIVSGGAREGGGCAPAANPCAQAVPQQASRRERSASFSLFKFSLYRFAHRQRPTFWRSRHQKAGMIPVASLTL